MSLNCRKLSNTPVESVGITIYFEIERQCQCGYLVNIQHVAGDRVQISKLEGGAFKFHWEFAVEDVRHGHMTSTCGTKKTGKSAERLTACKVKSWRELNLGIYVLADLKVQPDTGICTNAVSVPYNNTTSPTMEDGSSVRIKVAQYFVNKKLQELAEKDPKIKPDDLTFLQALPHFKPSHDEPSQGTTELEHGHDDSPQLPPLFPAPSDGHVSWESLLEFNRKRRTPPGDPRFPPERPIYPPWFSVAIIGAGVTGLRTAKLLQDMGIPYKIFEASDRPGGRVFTYQFSPKTTQGKHDYYDVGAMRYPDNDASKKPMELFKELGLSSKLTKYVMSSDDNIRYFNKGHKGSPVAVANTAGDHFKDKTVPKEYLNKEYTDLRGKLVFGVNACIAAAFDPFRAALIADFDKGWKELMKYDWASARSYLAREKPQYPLPVVNWLETRNGGGTGSFDRALSETILHSLDFNDPTKDVNWWCLEGGSEVLIDAMLKALTVKPSYGQRVTSVKQAYLRPSYCIPNLPHWPRWPRSSRFPMMRVSVEGQSEEYFAHVVSTVPFANLRTVDTEQVPMSYTQRQAIRIVNYGPSVKVAIKFKTRWWEQDGVNQYGGSSYTDRQSQVIVYPSYGLGEDGPGVLIVSYNLQQDASRFGALIQNPDWSEQLDPDRQRPRWEKVLLDQIYADLAALHDVDESQLREDTLDYHAFDWYHNPYTMGAFAHFAPGQYSTFLADILQPSAYGRFHFAGEVASHHHAWVAGALDSAVRVVDEILHWDFPFLRFNFKNTYGRSLIFRDDKTADEHFDWENSNVDGAGEGQKSRS
ncbi:hypothetical protein GALMADRAFT_282406 [Galerina marginata CBS 339.88]|uniref:Amine oxidase domain-containing protein n=1 Tax=Galerina marginata (strain CBS 339.88) TaxID=685588 RepID=A0A067SGJ4_GALM3|nr:hypothetical protein GALMADRAFT_282406 [Galerina marginata CBS 339.88]